MFFGDGSYQFVGEKQIKKYQYDSKKYARKVRGWVTLDALIGSE